MWLEKVMTGIFEDASIKSSLIINLQKYSSLNTDDLLDKRYQRLLNIGK